MRWCGQCDFPTQHGGSVVIPSVHPYVLFSAILGLTFLVALLGCIRWPRIPPPSIWSRQVSIRQAAEMAEAALANTDMGYFARELGVGIHYYYTAMLLDSVPMYGRQPKQERPEWIDYARFHGSTRVTEDGTGLRYSDDFGLVRDEIVNDMPCGPPRNVEGPPLFVDVRVRKRDVKRFIANRRRLATTSAVNPKPRYGA